MIDRGIVREQEKVLEEYGWVRQKWGQETRWYHPSDIFSTPVTLETAAAFTYRHDRFSVWEYRREMAAPDY